MISDLVLKNSEVICYAFLITSVDHKNPLVIITDIIYRVEREIFVFENIIIAGVAVAAKSCIAF